MMVVSASTTVLADSIICLGTTSSMARTTASKEAVVCALLVPARASPVPITANYLSARNSVSWCTCVSASARQSRAQCCAREFRCKILFVVYHRHLC